MASLPLPTTGRSGQPTWLVQDGGAERVIQAVLPQLGGREGQRTFRGGHPAGSSAWGTWLPGRRAKHGCCLVYGSDVHKRPVACTNNSHPRSSMPSHSLQRSWAGVATLPKQAGAQHASEARQLRPAHSKGRSRGEVGCFRSLCTEEAREGVRECEAQGAVQHAIRLSTKNCGSCQRRCTQAPHARRRA